MLNSVSLQGRCPFAISYKEDGDKLKAFFNLMVKRDYKVDGAEYADDDKIFCVATGAQAKFLQDYEKQGDSLCINGRLVFVAEDEEKEKPEYLFVKVDHVYIVSGGSKEPKEKEESSKSSKTSSKTGIGGNKAGIGGNKAGIGGNKTGIGGSKSGIGSKGIGGKESGLKTANRKFSR